MRASDFTNDMSEEVQDVGSGFDPDAFGGVEMALMGSGEEVAGLLGSGGRRQKPGVKQEGLIKASRDKTCVYLLFMAAAWALLLVVAALSSSLEPAFPRTPPNEDAPGVPVLPLTPAPWLVQATEYGKGGDVLEHLEQGPTNTTSPRLCQGAQMFSTGCLGSVVGYDGAEDSEALSGVLEGSVRPGSWKFFRYRLGNVTRAGEVHLRLPALTNLLSNATCSGACPCFCTKCMLCRMCAHGQVAVAREQVQCAGLLRLRASAKNQACSTTTLPPATGARLRSNRMRKAPPSPAPSYADPTCGSTLAFLLHLRSRPSGPSRRTRRSRVHLLP